MTFLPHQHHAAATCGVRARLYSIVCASMGEGMGGVGGFFFRHDKIFA